ncbi:pyrimidine dimer DNA glycosylase/endonuclease V [Candidatus Tisiphia endosymbiont of Melanophora roralis]|uniref:pyrimidine dimer DNA glycosylase/endonuclease V n=1 Tax=Candidatus Tisiphia endosymbiont of Melanophora roralis TaxID=3066261 RepID=UPI001E71F9A3|nr:MAG: pyrimidine dimer DNA glycosylase/endonuclease V [Rickettsia endosymbiont of Cimex lectularius]
MNIFITNICPILSAQALDNKRVLKMIVESAQLLSTAIFCNSQIVYPDIYKPTHLKHPCTIWASSNRNNWFWLSEHLIALCHEYTHRYHKKHKTQQLISNLLKYSSHLIDDNNMTPFVNCTKSDYLQIDFSNHSNTFKAYQQYLTVKWNNDIIKPKWTNRSIPKWYTQEYIQNY